MWNTYKKMEIINYFEKCNFCKRDMLVQVTLFGINHNAGLSVVCKDCIRIRGISKKFKKQSPESAKEIEKWMQG